MQPFLNDSYNLIIPVESTVWACPDYTDMILSMKVIERATRY